MERQIKGSLLLLTTAIIWGLAFVAQSKGMDYIGPFTYNMARHFIAFFVMIPIVVFFRKKSLKDNPKNKEEIAIMNKNSLMGGVFCGIVLGFAGAFQQIGLTMTTAGKTGFISALYIVIVPILGIFLKKPLQKSIVFCLFLAITGFYLLCVKEGFDISPGDVLCLFCAIGFSFHILIVDHYSLKSLDGVLMSCVQFLIAGIISAILTFIFENPSISSIWDAKLTILYAAILSSCLGYTFQIIGQGFTPPAIATLIMSLESVFAALFGAIFLKESLSPKELAGCVLVFVAVILAQLPLPKAKKIFSIFNKKGCLKIKNR
ncbi:EamA-like transporter family protein [Acetitomaculum ruminis DSM 5522]|uniref:EamA-like transporter family protein n=1 Tax=Acetitomaculum ruminis DSM 5522 TaxID=1120918 RepID=A0A1I0ZRY7_9FIRM|nr:DMT family transporter [Acetitomaculum ruminis]SFB27200.1 EamA-like transporter family protein [Acetitomaculum ruminis DSM 5522]